MKVIVVGGAPVKACDSLSEADLSDKEVNLVFKRVADPVPAEVLVPKKRRQDRSLLDVFVKHDASNVRKMGRRRS